MTTPNPGHVTDRVWRKHLAAARAYAATLTPGQAGVMLALAEDAVTRPSYVNTPGGCNHGKEMSVHKARVIALRERS